MIYLSGPGHGGNAMVAQDYLDGSYTDAVSYTHLNLENHSQKRLYKRGSLWYLHISNNSCY